jgi:hypothetical protein
MRRLGNLLLTLGALMGGAVGVGLLLGISLPGVPWLIAVGLVKLALLGSGGLMATGAVLQRLSRRSEDRARLSRPSDEIA